MDAFTSTAQFIAHEDFQSKEKCLEFLTAHGKEEGCAPLPLNVLQAVITGFSDEIDAKFSELGAKKTAALQWKAAFSCLPEDTFTDGAQLTALVKPLEIDGVEGKSTAQSKYLKITNPKAIRQVCDFLAKLKKKIEDEEVSKTKPKKKGGSRGARKADSDYEIKMVHEDKPPQGNDYAYSLAWSEFTDENATMNKDGNIIRIGAKGNENGTKDIKTRRSKAVKKQRPFLSKTGWDGETETDGVCCDAGITWDRAGGSEVLKKMGIKGAFVMGCSCVAEEGSTKCAKHSKVKESIFDGVYKTGKLAKVPYAQFLWESSQWGDVVADDVDEEWVKSKVGDKWVEAGDWQN